MGNPPAGQNAAYRLAWGIITPLEGCNIFMYHHSPENYICPFCSLIQDIKWKAIVNTNSIGIC